MSGFDNSQPIADEESLKDVDIKKAATPADDADDPEKADADELGDATPGPR
jgi:hypothetical protein